MGFTITLDDVTATEFQTLMKYRNRREELQAEDQARNAAHQASLQRSVSSV